MWATSLPIRYAVVTGLALAILLTSAVEPGEGGRSTVFGIGATAYLHLLAYSALAFTIGYARWSTDRRTQLVVVAVATGYGALIELIQGTIPYRTMSALDVLLNAVGATVGAFLWRIVAQRLGIDGESTSL